MSVHRGRPEVAGAGQTGAIDPSETSKPKRTLSNSFLGAIRSASELLGDRMKQLALILLWSVAIGSATSAQPAPERAYRVGFISVNAGSIGQFRRFGVPELAKRGFVEGRNLTLDTRFGEPHEIPGLAKDLVSTRPGVIVAVSIPVIRAVASASSRIPIVAAFFGSDPVAEGMAVSLAKPGGHITGVAMLAEALDAKRFDILSESLPAIRKVAILAGRPPRHDANIKAVAAAAQKLGIELMVVEADSPAEYPGAFAKMRAAEVQGLLIVSAPDFNRDGAILAEAARVAKLPTICEWREMVDSGCLMAYGPLKEELTRRAAAYVVQILRGVAPGDLPIETPTHFEFVVNQKIATDLGVRFEPATLIRADEVIE
jgi:putative tryptophan/tyrosine transport system substrate-binding protein